MATYLKPGAYIEWQDATAATINPLRTDVAGFVGLARRGPVDVPVPVESFRQFEAHFGSFMGAGFLAYAVRGFFENGGRRCWVVRVAAHEGARRAEDASVELRPTSGLPGSRWRIAASSPGTWGNAITVSVSVVTPAETVSAGGLASSRFLNVASVAGFQRGDLLRLLQPGLQEPLFRVLSFVDGGARRLYFVHPEPGGGLPYDRPLTAFDPDQPLQVASIAYTLQVRYNGRPLAFYPALTLVPEHPRYGPIVLPPPSSAHLHSFRGAVPTPPAAIKIEELALDPSKVPERLEVTQGQTLALSGGADGLADLTEYDFLGDPGVLEDGHEARRRKVRGIRALDQIDEVAIVAAPDFVVQPLPEPSYALRDTPPRDPCLRCPSPEPETPVQQPTLVDEMPPIFSDEAVFRMQSALVDLCEARRDRIALLDPPASTVQDALGYPMLQAWRARFDSRHAALYYPWLRVVDSLAAAPTRAIPPCGHVAGQYAKLDLEVGVHRAPANRVLSWTQDVMSPVDDARHAELNLMGVNVIRTEPGRGLRILGARTLSSDPLWRYVNVRRLVMMVMKAIDAATQWAVFEPNDHGTRTKITLALTEFLTALWQRGALVGPTPDTAFVVRCDEVNNPPEAREDGRMLAEVALAPSQPFEFVVLRVGRQGNAFEIEESGRGGVRRP